MLPEFLNVDLELESRQSLDLIAKELGKKVTVLYNDSRDEGIFLLALEIYTGDNHDPDAIISAFCEVISGLSVKAKAVWRRAFARRFDIGVSSGMVDKKKFKVLRLDLNPETLKRVAALSAQVVITIYPIRSTAKSKKK